MTKRLLMNENDYCYACVAVSPTGKSYICGFSRNFDGLVSIREDYLYSCECKNIVGITFDAPERWSRNNLIDFFNALKARQVKGTYLLRGFITGKDKLRLNIPYDVEAFLCLKELYADRIE